MAFCLFNNVEYRQKNAEKKSGLAKESNNRKGKRKEPPVAEKADKEDGNEDEEVEDSADDWEASFLLEKQKSIYWFFTFHLYDY